MPDDRTILSDSLDHSQIRGRHSDYFTSLFSKGTMASLSFLFSLLEVILMKRILRCYRIVKGTARIPADPVFVKIASVSVDCDERPRDFGCRMVCGDLSVGRPLRWDLFVVKRSRGSNYRHTLGHTRRRTPERRLAASLGSGDRCRSTSGCI